MAVASYDPRILIPKYGQTANAKPLTTKRSQWKCRDQPHNDYILRQTNYLEKKPSDKTLFE